MERIINTGQIISVFTNKGGVAKTTTALSLGHALSILGVKTLIIDIDPQCNATASLVGYGPQNNLMDVMTDKIDIEKSIRPVAAQKGLFCLPNASALGTIEPRIFRMGGPGFFVLRDKIQSYCKENFQVTIIDCPPGYGILTVNALVASDLAIVPVGAGSSTAIDGLMTALELIDEIKQDDNGGLKFLKMLVTMVDGRALIDKKTISQLRDLFEDQIFSTYIPTNVDFKYAEGKKQTIFQYRPKAAGGEAYMAVAKELLEILGLNS